jgi:hypothetical protein
MWVNQSAQMIRDRLGRAEEWESPLALHFLVVRPANEASSALTLGEGQVGLDKAFGSVLLA